MEESLSYNLFGKEIHDLLTEDIQAFFQNEKRETDKIEFKSYQDFSQQNSTKTTRDKEKINDIIRSICGFLNSDGGLLIWGAPAGKDVEGYKEKSYSGALTPVTVKIEPDQFINRVAMEISPTPLRVLFQSIKSGADSFYYIFEVKRSEFAPHQFKGTYYMRLDGSTRPAPHHYVEALMKKISFPRLQGFLRFGDIREYRDNAIIPMQISLHNLSKYIHEKNVTYRIISDRGAVVDAYKNPGNAVLVYHADIEKSPKSILHYNAPVYNDYLLITKRMLPGASRLKISIMISFCGELSPVIISKYELQIYYDAQTHRTKYHIAENKENVYLFEAAGSESESERMLKSRTFLMEQFQKELHNLPIFRT